MRVCVLRGGGLAGLLTLTCLDEADLPPSGAQQLRARGDTADVFNLPEHLPDAQRAAPNHPDRFFYEVSIRDGERRHRVRRREQDLSSALRELIRMVETAPQRSSRVLPPGTQAE